MLPGRIEYYIHSDSITMNKAGCLIEVGTETEFAARSQEFIDFSKELAKIVFAFEVHTISMLEMFKDIRSVANLLEKKESLEKALKEKIVLRQATFLRLTDAKNYELAKEAVKQDRKSVV